MNFSVVKRESGHENRAFEYALIENRIDEKLSYRADEDWKASFHVIVLTAEK
jgi:hypothetical protein